MGFCQQHTVYRCPRHHRRVGLMVTYSTHAVVMLPIGHLLCDNTPAHPIFTLTHGQSLGHAVNLQCEVTGQLQPAPDYQQMNGYYSRYHVNALLTQAKLLQIFFPMISNLCCWNTPLS
jgi:hypothetical protein